MESRNGADKISERKTGSSYGASRGGIKGQVDKDRHTLSVWCVLMLLNHAGWKPSRPFSNPIALYFSGHCPLCHYGSLRMCKFPLPYQNLNSLKASPSLTHLCTLFPVHTQCLAQRLAYNQYNKYLLDGLITTLYCLVSNMTK